MTRPTAGPRRPRVPLKTVALPNEHGAWALVRELGFGLLYLLAAAAGYAWGV